MIMKIDLQNYSETRFSIPLYLCLYILLLRNILIVDVYKDDTFVNIFFYDSPSSLMLS